MTWYGRRSEFVTWLYSTSFDVSWKRSVETTRRLATLLGARVSPANVAGCARDVFPAFPLLHPRPPRIGLVKEPKRDGHPPQSGCPIRKREEIVIVSHAHHRLPARSLALDLIRVGETFRHDGGGRGDQQREDDQELLHFKVSL
jgi:hypothetical protein